jgi:hypothetical protein
MTHDQNSAPDDYSGLDAPEQHLPVEDRASRNAPVARQPMEQIGRAMQVQSELLKQMHERQRMLEDVVKDNRRHELMINSAQALNESFQGLQRVQERLADKLDEGSGSSRARFAILTIALLLLVAIGGILTWRIVDSADSLNANLKSALTPNAREQELQADLARLESRVRDVEEADRAAFQAEIEKLRKGLSEITSDNEQLRRERDGALEGLGATKAILTGAQTELADLKGKSQTLEKDNARLTAQGVADQKTITQLNDVIAMMKEARSPAPTKAPDDEVAQKGSARPDAPPGDRASPPPAGGTSEAAVTSASSDALAPFTIAQVDALNLLLKSHRGSDRYELKKVEKSGQKKLWSVTMEVRGPDGNLVRTIDSESMAFWIKGDLLEIEFQGGSVTFHQGMAGKSTKSPFFNDRYVIVVLGTNGKEWLAANHPFVRTRS